MESIIQSIFNCCFDYKIYDPRSLVKALGVDYEILMSRAIEDFELCGFLYVAFMQCRYRCLEDHLLGNLSQNDAKAYIEQIDDDVKLFLQDILFPVPSEGS